MVLANDCTASFLSSCGGTSGVIQKARPHKMHSTSTVHALIYCKIKAIYLIFSTFLIIAQTPLLINSFQLRAQIPLLFFMPPFHKIMTFRSTEMLRLLVSEPSDPSIFQSSPHLPAAHMPIHISMPNFIVYSMSLSVSSA